MYPKRLWLENFLSHEKSEIVFDNLLEIALIIGRINGNPGESNGSGKTALLEAILFALFEKCRISDNKNATIDKMVRNEGVNGEIMLVGYEFCLERNGPTYRIVRQQDNKRNKSKCILSIKGNKKWKDISLDKKAKTNKKIAKLIGVDYDTFISTVCFQQEEINNFLKARTTGRRNMVNKILQLLMYADYRDYCKNKIKDFDEKLSTYICFLEENKNATIERISSFEEKVQRLSLIDSYSCLSKKLEEDLEKLRIEQSKEGEKIIRIEALEKELISLGKSSDRSLEELEKARERLEKYDRILFNKRELFLAQKTKLEELNKNRLDKEQLKTRMIKLTKSSKEIKQRKNEITEAIGNIKGQMDGIRKAIETGEGVCPTCYTKVTKDHLSHLEKENIDILNKRLEDMKNKKEELEKESTANNDLIDNQKEQVNKYNYSVKQKNSLKREMAESKRDGVEVQESISDHKELIKQYGRVLLETEEKIKIKKQELDKIGKVDVENHNKINKTIKEKNIKIEETNKIINKMNIEIGKIESKIMNYDKIIEKIEEIKRDQSEILKERCYYEELAKAFDSKSGIPTYILETVLPELTHIVNNILSKLSDSLSIRIETQKTNRDGTIAEAFDIFVYNRGKERLIDLLSTGQKFRVVFSIRVALSLLLARRSGQKIGFLFYDECFANLDDSGIGDAIELFRELTKHFKHQLIITHRPDMKDRFEGASLIAVEGNGYDWSRVVI